MNTLNVISKVLVIVGAVNWGLVGLFRFDLVAAIFGMAFGQVSTASAVVYVLVALAGLYLAVVWLSQPRMARGPATPRVS